MVEGSMNNYSIMIHNQEICKEKKLTKDWRKLDTAILYTHALLNKYQSGTKQQHTLVKYQASNLLYKYCHYA